MWHSIKPHRTHPFLLSHLIPWDLQHLVLLVPKASLTMLLLPSPQ